MHLNTNAQPARLRRLACLACLAGVWICASIARGQVSLPLNGYIRAGEFMPVQVNSDVRELRADGVVRTRIGEGVRGIVPVLVLSDAPGTLKAGEVEIPLRSLQPDERLVGVASGDSAIAAKLFPGQSIVTVSLDASQPLPGPAMAWGALDAVILDVMPANIDELLAGGMTVAVRGTSRPDGRWPWRRVDDVWVFQFDPKGLMGSIGGEAAYLPTQAWTPGTAERLRQQILLAGVLALLLLGSAMLLGGRRAMIGMVAVAVVLGGAIEWWRRSQPAISVANGAILVQTSNMFQRDDWTYFAAGTRAAEGSFQDGRPIVASITHAERCGLFLEIPRIAPPTWRYTLPPHARLATLHRSFGFGVPLPQTIENPITSPLFELARQAYLSPGARMAGQFKQAQWPWVYVVQE